MKNWYICAILAVVFFDGHLSHFLIGFFMKFGGNDLPSWRSSLRKFIKKNHWFTPSIEGVPSLVKRRAPLIEMAQILYIYKFIIFEINVFRGTVYLLIFSMLGSQRRRALRALIDSSLTIWSSLHACKFIYVPISPLNQYYCMFPCSVSWRTHPMIKGRICILKGR